jgi:hypothetical protein
MPAGIRRLLIVVELGLAPASNLVAQQTEAETQRATLTGLRRLAVHARVQLSPEATLQRIDESVLRGRIEKALRREGISIDGRTDVRDGSQASLELLYMVIETGDTNRQTAGFAASSCLQASQMVRIPRLTTPKHIAYAVVSTWRSCGLVVGHKGAYGEAILQNADEQITRFSQAWRMVNPFRPEPPPGAAAELETPAFTPPDHRPARASFGLNSQRTFTIIHRPFHRVRWR